MNEALNDRYPGTRPFDDTAADQMLFFGRAAELESLYHRLCANRLLVLFGKSGLGKTSLLKAGLFPRMREHDYLPIPVRLNQAFGSPTALIAAAAEAATRNTTISYTAGSGTSLWEFLKTAMFWRGDAPLTPVLILDQFEEIFTLRALEERRALADELGDLASGNAPLSFCRRRHAGETHLSDQAPDVKLLISLREDYLGALQELSATILGIFDNRVRLRPMTRRQAVEAICKPAQIPIDGRSGRPEFKTRPFSYRLAALKDLLRFLEGRSKVIEPFQLQLLCQDIERKVARAQAKNAAEIRVGRADLGGLTAMAGILRNFYLATIAKLSGRRARKNARRLCEEGLLTSAGNRLMLLESQIVETYRITREHLATLVQERLLRKEERLENNFYELSHDSLAQPILDCRPWRLPKPLRYGLFAVALIFIGASWAQNYYRSQADNLAKQAQQARAEFETIIAHVVSDLRDKLEPIGRLDIAEDVAKHVIEVYDKLDTNDPLVHQRHAAARISYGDILVAKGDALGAIEQYSEARTATNVLIEKEPTNAKLQRDLAISARKLGSIRRARGELQKAQDAYEESLRIDQQLSRQDPGNVVHQRNVSVRFNKLGSIYAAKGELDAALKAYQNSLAIRRNLVAQDPHKVRWQIDLATSLIKTASLRDPTGRPLDPEARETRLEARAILEKLEAAQNLPASNRALLEHARRIHLGPAD
jgi:tetratricopeptide (TPR) repeat protein